MTAGWDADIARLADAEYRPWTAEAEYRPSAPTVIERPEGWYLQDSDGWDAAFLPREDGAA